MDLEEIENFQKTLKICPDCGSAEGFWLIAKSDKTYFQCKHCATILEICEVVPDSKTMKVPKKFLGRLRT